MTRQPEQPTDNELLAAWRGGDNLAGNRLFERHHRSILRFFTNKVGPDCEDLVQATFLACVEGIDRFRGDSSFRTLLFAIAWNKLHGHFHASTRAHENFDPRDDPVHASAPTFGTLLAARQEQALLRVAMSELPLDVRTMLELHYWEAMSIKEIARVFDRKVSTVKTRMRRGREQLERECEALRAARGREARRSHRARSLEAV